MSYKQFSAQGSSRSLTMSDGSTRYKWEARGIVAVIILVISSVLIISGLYAIGRYTVPETAMYISGTSVFATVALAAVIFYQTKLNEDQLRQNEQQSLILQESEWMPEAVPFFNKGYLMYRGPMPINPKVKVERDGYESDWIGHTVGEKDSTTNWDWESHLRKEVRDEIRDVQKGEIDIVLSLRYESQTGEQYTDIYSLTSGEDSAGKTVVKWTTVNRVLPWEEHREKCQ